LCFVTGIAGAVFAAVRWSNHQRICTGSKQQKPTTAPCRRYEPAQLFWLRRRGTCSVDCYASHSYVWDRRWVCMRSIQNANVVAKVTT